ncbi:MAG: glycosyltransferase family 4 protein [Sphingomonadales bacterium]|nr:glycosyltransferase family 4 protein [Sphingomonadales bacterium]
MIVINGRFTTQNITGVQRASYEIVRRLIGLRDDIRVVSPASPLSEYYLPVDVVPGPFGGIGGHAWEQTVLRTLVGPRDLLLGYGGTGPILSTINQVIVIHDANYIEGPAAYSANFRRAYRIIQGWHASRSHICTVSGWSAASIGAAFGVDPARMDIIPNAADHVLELGRDPSVLLRQELVRPFLLCVGSANPNKNFPRVIDAYKLLDAPEFDLVIVGGGAAVFANAALNTDGDGIRQLGYVTDEELRSLYEAASAYVMPSLLEGFGIPAVEAMTLGCPVIASNVSALPEVCGDAALYFDPLDPADIARAMLQIVGDAALRDTLRAAGIVRAARYSWQHSAELLNDVLNRASE